MKRLAALLCASIGSTAVQAQTSVFDGQWRIVSAQPAPWEAKRASAAPLLRTELTFKDGAARLPSPMKCDNPGREEALIPSRWLLGGEMSGRTLRAFYAEHEITEGTNLHSMTLTCGDDRELKLVLAEPGRALLAHGGWVYTLCRRESAEFAVSGRRRTKCGLAAR